MGHIRKTQFLLFKTLLVLLLLFLPASAGAIEGYIVKFRTSGPTSGERVEYITPRAYKSVSPDSIQLVTIDKGSARIYSINPQTKTYMDMTKMAGMMFIGMMEFMECSEGTYPPQCREREDFLVPLGVKEKVGKWTAQKFRINPSKQGMMGGLMQAFKTESYAWYSKEPKTLIEAEKTRIRFFENLLKAMKKQMDPRAAVGSQDVYGLAIKAMKRYLKAYGVRVKQVTSSNIPFGQSTTTEEFVSARKANIPLSEFKIPEGYKPQQFGSPGGFGM